MYIAQKELSGMMDIATFSQTNQGDAQSRQTLLQKLLTLCKAQYGASFVWDKGLKRFNHAVFENMSANNIEQYDSYFQFHDPITPKLSTFRRAVAVSQVMPHRQMVNTEFYNDFLQQDGLKFGVNLYIYLGNQQVFDIRLWRDRQSSDFDNHQLLLLDNLIPALRTMAQNNLETVPLTSNIATRSYYQHFTKRELDVLNQLRCGLSDKRIAQSLCMSITTVRTHLRAIYKKSKVHSRAQLLSLGIQ